MYVWCVCVCVCVLVCVCVCEHVGAAGLREADHVDELQQGYSKADKILLRASQ